MTYFADGRLNTVGTIPLAELTGNATTPLPVPDGVLPVWLVPSEVSQLDAMAVADQPVNMDFFFQSGNPDVYSAAVGNSASVRVTAPQVSPGIWESDIGQSGPFDGPAPAGTVTASASAIGKLFDSALTSSTGDFWLAGVDPSASPALTAAVRHAARAIQSANGASPATTAAVQDGPLTLNPGQSGTISVTITPSGPVGSVVKGTLYIDSFDGNVDSSDELIDLPYQYKIK
jgi:hypothetical protein